MQAARAPRRPLGAAVPADAGLGLCPPKRHRPVTALRRAGLCPPSFLLIRRRPPGPPPTQPGRSCTARIEEPAPPARTASRATQAGPPGGSPEGGRQGRESVREAPAGRARGQGAWAGRVGRARGQGACGHASLSRENLSPRETVKISKNANRNSTVRAVVWGHWNGPRADGPRESRHWGTQVAEGLWPTPAAPCPTGFPAFRQPLRPARRARRSPEAVPAVLVSSPSGLSLRAPVITEGDYSDGRAQHGRKGGPTARP